GVSEDLPPRPRQLSRGGVEGAAGNPDLAHVVPKHRHDGGRALGFFDAEAFGLSAATERTLARGADVSDPVGLPIACDRPPAAIQLDDVDRSRIEPAGLASGP